MPSTPPGTSTSPLEILVVDDELEVREGISELLTERGHHVRTVGSAREAMISLRTDKVDLVIMDVCMPRMDGVELAAMIRMAHPFVELVLMSGGCPETSRTAARKLRIGEIVNKPFRMSAIEPTLERMTARMASTGKISIPPY